MKRIERQQKEIDDLKATVQSVITFHFTYYSHDL